MLRRLSLGLLASAISVASLPVIAQEKGSADDLGVMSISLKDVVKSPPLGFKGRCKELEHRIRQVSAGSFHCLSATTASGFLMSSLTLISLITRTTAALLIPPLLVPRSAPHQGLVIAG